METTSVRTWMEQGCALPLIIRSMEMQLQAAADQVYGLASPSGLLGTRVQASSASNAAFTRALERKEQTEREVDARLARCMLLRDQIVRAINRHTEGRENYILTARFVVGKTWQQIAEEAFFSTKQVRRICYGAIEKIILPENAVWLDLPGKAA